MSKEFLLKHAAAKRRLSPYKSVHRVCEGLRLRQLNTGPGLAYELVVPSHNHIYRVHLLSRESR